MRSVLPSRTIAAALLAASSLVNAAWFLLQDDGLRITFGAAGAVAVGLAWASAARSLPRALARSVLAAGVILGASALTFGLWMARARSMPLGPTLLQAVGLDGAFDDGRVYVAVLVIPPTTANAWAGMALGVLLAGLAGPTAARLARGARRPMLNSVALVTPFAVLAAAAAVDGAYVACLVAALAACWLVVGNGLARVAATPDTLSA